MNNYRPLIGKDSGIDFRSTFSYTSGAKPPSSETKYSTVSIDVIPGTQYMNPSESWLNCFCTTLVKIFAYFCFVITFPFSAIVCFKMVHQYERIIVYRIGRLLPLKGPGFVFVLPCIDRWSKVDLRTKAFNVPPTRVCTSDGGLLLIGGVIHYRVQNPLLVKNSLQDMNHSVRVMAQAATSKILSKKRFAEVMSSSLRYNYDIQVEINDGASDWGLEIGRVELSQPVIEVVPPQKQSGFMDKLSSGFQGGGGDAMAQIMGMMGGSFSNQSAPKPLPQDAASVPVDTETAINNLLKIVMSLLSAELVSKVAAAYEIKLTDNAQYYYIDLKSSSGSCGKGHLPGGIAADATLILSFKTLRDMLAGETGAFSAYTSGELEVQGDVRTAMKLEELVKCMKS